MGNTYWNNNKKQKRFEKLIKENFIIPVDEYELFKINGETISFLYFSAYHYETSKKVPF